VAVITCRWEAHALAAHPLQVPELVAASAQACLQGWVQRVTGSFFGRTPGGTWLLLVPVYALAEETEQALDALLHATTKATAPGAGRWVLRVIGPVQPGTPDQVQRQLAQAGWPVS
jgi:hypothetical protein